MFLVFKENIAHLKHGPALKTLMVASVERLKSLFVHAKYTQARCFRTMHVPIKFNNAFVIPRITRECTAHRNCSDLFHTCLQRNIGSCTGGKFRDG